jgi:4-amino-4-deoxy-L-arabinose transferase-like glycosyltransferase
MSRVSSEPDGVAPLPSLAAGEQTRAAAWAVLALCVFTLWSSLGDHPLYIPDEGRYARTSQVMLETGDLIVPQINDKPRLQKPPVVYWLQAASMRIFGENEFAVRAPSAASITLTLLLLVWVGARLRDTTTGLLAAGLMLVSPLVIACGRLSIIDPILTLFWTGATFSGYLATSKHDAPTVSRDGRVPNPQSAIRNPQFVFFWFWVSAAVLTKGPIGLLPALVLLVWVAMTGQWRWELAWKWAAGLVVTAAPLAIWVGIVVATHPTAIAVWKKEIIDRATGNGDHPAGLWYYPVVFVGGFFPATALLPLPWLHYDAAAVRQWVRERTLGPYLALSVIVPLIVMSLIKGKLATYILPLAPAVALSAAMGLRGWLAVREDHKQVRADASHPARKLPDGMLSIAVAVTAAWAAAMVYALDESLHRKINVNASVTRSLLEIAGPMVLTVAGVWAVAWMWRRARLRAWAAVLLIAAFCAGHFWIIEFAEDQITMPYGNRNMLAEVDRRLGGGPRYFSTLGFIDLSLSFYCDRTVMQIDRPDTLQKRPAPPGERWVILAWADRWDVVVKNAPDFAAKFEPLMNWPHRRHEVLVLVEKSGA